MNALQINLRDQVVVFRPGVFQVQYQALTFRIWKVIGGYGATPMAQGRTVICRSLLTQEEAQFDGMAIERLATADDLAVVEAARGR